MRGESGGQERVGVKEEVNGGIGDTILGSFNIHDASSSVNLAIKMNSDFLSDRKRCDLYVSVVIDKTSHKAIFSRRRRTGTAMTCLT